MRMMLLGDPHLKISKFNQSVELLRWFNLMIEEHKPDLVVNLGDCFDNHAVLRSEIMYHFKQHVLQCKAPYYYVLGNHDQWKPNDSTYHALQPYDIPHMRVFDKRTDVDGVSYVPYMHDFTKFPVETQPICIAHQTFVGADYGYYRPDVGADADKCNAEIIISGHVHMRQTFGKVHYPGTPVAENLHDLDQIKGIEIFDTDTYDFQFIESPFPRYRGLSFTVGGDFTTSEMHASIESSVNDRDYWVIKVEGPKPEITHYQKSSDWLELQKQYNIRMKPEYTSGNKVARVKIKSVEMPDIVSEYIDNIYSGTLDRDMLKSLSHGFINKSKKSTV